MEHRAWLTPIRQQPRTNTELPPKLFASLTRFLKLCTGSNRMGFATIWKHGVPCALSPPPRARHLNAHKTQPSPTHPIMTSPQARHRAQRCGSSPPIPPYTPVPNVHEHVCVREPFVEPRPREGGTRRPEPQGGWGRRHGGVCGAVVGLHRLLVADPLHKVVVKLEPVVCIVRGLGRMLMQLHSIPGISPGRTSSVSHPLTLSVGLPRTQKDMAQDS
jgi:hypothetical protein